jgi:hypothetical protein
MKTARVFVVLAAAAALLAIPASAQEKPGDVALVYTAKAKANGWMQLDAAAKKHFAWHRAQKDPFAWFVWQVASGEDVGDFVVGTFGHHWKEWDARAAFDAADDADFVANVMPLVEKVDLGYWSYLGDVSRPASVATPAAMAQITHYFVKPEAYTDFVDALRQMRAAMEGMSYPMTFSWYRLISGGESPQFVLAVDRASWADMEPAGKPLDAALAEKVGAQKAVALLATIREATRYTRSYLLRYRADLSYTPAK